MTFSPKWVTFPVESILLRVMPYQQQAAPNAPPPSSRTKIWRRPQVVCSLLLLLATHFALPPLVEAALVEIEFYDQGAINPSFAGGPRWTGVVDTQLDTLTIKTWTELPLHGSTEFWIPRALPLTWPARDAAGNRYDVPDTFAGQIDDTFAFISDDRLQDMPWKKSLFDYDPYNNDPNKQTPPTFLGAVDVVYNDVTMDVWPGWGGYALQRNIGGNIVKVFETANPSSQAGQPDFDEQIMPAIPVQPDGAFPTITAADGATITVTTVPEAKAWLSLAFVALISKLLLRSQQLAAG